MDTESKVNRKLFRFADLYAGIGGMRIPFEAVGGECVYTTESDKYCRETYRANFGQVDIAEFTPTKDSEIAKIPQHDVLLAGFPCQPFSIALAAHDQPITGFAHKSGGEFYNISRILEKCRPMAFLLENVPFLLSHDGGRTIRGMMSRLELELGYQTVPMVIDSVDWVPQSRKRVFFVGFRNYVSFNPHNLRRPKIVPSLGDLLEKNPDPKYTLSKERWESAQALKARHVEKGNGFGFQLVGPDDRVRTLTASHPSRRNSAATFYNQPGQCPRIMTPREYARLMGFPDSFQIPVSDSQAYKQFGNAVVVSLVRSIAEEMVRHFG